MQRKKHMTFSTWSRQPVPAWLNLVIASLVLLSCLAAAVLPVVAMLEMVGIIPLATNAQAPDVGTLMLSAAIGLVASLAVPRMVRICRADISELRASA